MTSQTDKSQPPARRGILLAGGQATRLRPITLAVNKHLLPVYDKPLIYYGLTTLLHAGVRELALVTNPADLEDFEALLGDGAQFGISITYLTQEKPGGIAEAVLLASDFAGAAPVAVALGDNVFHGPQFLPRLARSTRRLAGATIFTCAVEDPGRFGIAEFDDGGRVIAVTEKPDRAASNQAITGLYLYDNRVFDFARALRPSARGELEITDVNRAYLQHGELAVELIGPEDIWFDAGTPDDLLRAGQVIEKLQRASGYWIGCPEEVAFRQGYITAEALLKTAAQLDSGYGAYLSEVATGAVA